MLLFGWTQHNVMLSSVQGVARKFIQPGPFSTENDFIKLIKRVNMQIDLKRKIVLSTNEQKKMIQINYLLLRKRAGKREKQIG